MNLAFIGIGQVGGALARALAAGGHTITIAARDAASDSVRSAVARIPQARVLPPAAAVAAADVVFLATPFAAAAATIRALAAELQGKILIDCTNPVGPGLTHGLGSARSGAEEIQAAAPGARVVKAFTIYGFENFESTAYPGYGDLKPAMMIAGDDVAAKRAVTELCVQLGWEPVDTGALSSGLHLEHLTLLWIKMARMNGDGSGFVWARLRR